MAHLKKFISIILVMALALSILPIIPAIAQPSVQPIVWYTFDNVEGTTVKDMSGNNNDGTLYGSAKTGSSGIDGNALILNENNENNGYMQLPSGIFKGVNDFTVATWVNVKSAESYARIFDFGMNSNGGNMFLTPFGGGQLVFAITNSGAGSEQRLTYTQLSTTDEWLHIAITMQGDTVTLYLNGVNVAQKDGFTFTPSSALGEDINNYIGKSFYGADRYFRGSFDDYRIYDSALSQKDLLSLAYPNIQNIVSIDNVTASTDIGIIPELPSYVTVHYEYGTSGSLPVVWDEMTSDMFLSGNDVNVYGFVPATEIKASAVVSINSISLVEDMPINVELLNDLTMPAGAKGIFNIYNNSDKAKDILLQIALYNEQSVLIGYASSQETIAANTLFNKDIKAIVPDEYINSSVFVKAFIWGGENYLTPLAQTSYSIYEPSTSGSLFSGYNVQLTDGIFADSRDVGAEYLLSFDCDRLLASLYLWTDKDGPKDVYWGWETDAEGNGIAGHSLGHYMSACVNMYMQTGNEEFKDRVDYMVDMMAKVQDDDGFLGGFKRELLDYVFENPATFPVGAFDLNSVWVPWYSLHKIYAGLLDAYTYLGNEQALDVMIGLADYAKAGTDKLNDEQMQRMLSCEHGGVNESFAQLYEITGEKKYLDLAKRFCHKAIMDPLAEGRDDLTGKHGNTQIPKIIGAAKIYELTGEEYYKNVAENFWKFVVYDRSYANGGNTLSEHFTGLGTEPLADNTTESCNTYNMLKLTEYLYSFDHKSEYIEYYENALYNHILGSQNPNDGHKTYFIDLRMGGTKTYRNDFECCVGSGMENPGRYYKMIYYKDGSDLFVNLFINSELNWAEKGIKLTQQTDFPDKDTSKITITQANNAFASIKVRIPEWVCSDATVSVNGQAITEKPVDGYITITRQWNTGDVIDIKLPMDLNLYVSRESNNVVAFKYGPVLLAGEMRNSDVLSLVVDSRDPNEFITRTSEDKAIFELDNILQPGTESMTLKPFYEFIDQRHMVYWNLYTNEEYEAIGGQVGESFNQKLDKISIDKVEPYFQQSEIDHNMQINGTSNSGYYEPANGGWRDAHGISSFSYDVKVDPTKTNYLLSVFWGSDGPFDNYTRQFDILVDGTPLKTDYILNNNKPNELIYEYYEIPAELLEGKDKVTVTYRSNSANTAAGGVFGVRITTEILMPE